MKKTTPLNVTGQPIVYSPVSYPVYDNAGPPFMESMVPGCANDATGKRNALLLVNHSSIAPPLASEAGGTMVVSDSPTALCFNASLDPANSLARDLVSAISRNDLTAMSVGFRVLDDEWSDDWLTRTVKSIELFDISAVNTPASPTTSISLVPPETAAKKKKPWDDGGVDGTQNAPYPYGGTMGGDGTGSRDKARWTNAERRARAGGIEQRANLAGTLEIRAFTVWTPSPEVVPVEEAPAKRHNDALRLELELDRLRRPRRRR